MKDAAQFQRGKRSHRGSRGHSSTQKKAADPIEVYIGGQSAARLSDDVLAAPVERELRRDIAARLRVLIWALENR